MSIASRTRHYPRIDGERGFSLPELLTVLVMICILASIAVPSYSEYAERARAGRAIADIRSLDLEIERFRLNNDDRIPDSLAELGIAVPQDPWGRPYRFLNIRNEKDKSRVRKDGKLNPINADFDLYSVGKDGGTAPPLPAKESRDDIVRASDGAFVGYGRDY
jgi:general secretion pathway protein G